MIGKLQTVSWHSKKAKAAYAAITTATGLVALLCGNGLLQESEPIPRIQSTKVGTATERDSVPARGPDRSDRAMLPDREPVLFGTSLHDLRASNAVRPLRYEEQSVDISRLSGIWGVTKASFFEDNMRREKALLYKVTLQNEPERYRAVVEIHKAVNAKVSVIGFVEEGTAARLADAVEAVGSIYLYHRPVREGLIPVAIPAARIADWDYRTPHDFSEVVIDRKNRR